MEEKMYDLIIAGAGPAGCSLALCLADSGLRMAIIDKDLFPRKKICGDALSGKVLSIMKRFSGQVYQDFIASVEKEPSWGIRFVGPNLKELDLPFTSARAGSPEPPGFVCPRSSFDNFLLKKVSALPNVTVIQDTKILEVTLLSEGIRVNTSRGVYTGKVIAGADGVHSVVRSLSQVAPSKKDHCLGVRAYFENVSGLHPENFIELIFLRKLLPGYLWIFKGPSGTCNVGLGLLHQQVISRKINLSALLLELLNNHPYLRSRFRDAKMIDRPQAHTLPLGSYRIRRSGNRFVLLGDAAYLVDPFSGEGIGNAMASGECAARAIRNCFLNNCFSESDLFAYDTMIEKRMGRELRVSTLLQRLSRSPFLFNYVVGKANKNIDLKELLSGMFTNEDLRAKLTRPAFYLSLLLR
ncbi:MAG: geranylgeranyl reductase family protein [bacterium]